MQHILLTPLEIQEIIRNELHLFFSEHKLKTETNKEDVWFDLTGLCNYLPDRPKPSTVYGWISDKMIPYHKKSKKISFLKSEIDLWLKSGRKKTKSEIDIEVDSFLRQKNKKTH